MKKNLSFTFKHCHWWQCYKEDEKGYTIEEKHLFVQLPFVTWRKGCQSHIFLFQATSSFVKQQDQQKNPFTLNTELREPFFWRKEKTILATMKLCLVLKDSKEGRGKVYSSQWDKVEVFWEGRKNLNKYLFQFWHHLATSKVRWIFCQIVWLYSN